MIESLGAEKFVYFTRDLGQTMNVAELEELARDAGRADASGNSETVVARLDPATRISEGQDGELWADVRKLHVFDPASGRNLSLGAAGAGAAPAGPAATTLTTAPTQATAAAAEQAPAEQAPAERAPAGPDGSAAQPAGGTDGQSGAAGS